MHIYINSSSALALRDHHMEVGELERQSSQGSFLFILMSYNMSSKNPH